MHSGESVDRGAIAEVGIENVILEAQRGGVAACRIIDEHAREGGAHSPAWHAMRRTGLGGSDWAAALGLNPYRAPVDVYAEKIGELEPFAGNEKTRWGTILESPIADEYQRLRAIAEGECHLDGPFGTERSDANHWHLYTVDRLVLSVAPQNAHCPDVMPAPDLIERVVEIKSRGFFMRRGYGDEGTDEIPFPDLCQLTCYVSGIGCDGGGDLAALFNTHELRVFHAERDLELEGSLLEQLGQWWQQHVVARVPPEADGSKQYAQYLRRRFDKTTHNLLEPDDETIELHRRLRAVECLARVVTDAKEQIRQQLQSRIGDAQGFELPDDLGKKSMFKHDSRGRVNHSAVAEDLADQLELSHKALKVLQDSHRYKPSRKWYSPRPWLKDEFSLDVAASVNATIAAILEPKPE